MSLEKNFRVEVSFFSLRSGLCSLFCMLFLALFARVLWCASMLFVVRFNIVCGALLHGLWRGLSYVGKWLCELFRFFKLTFKDAKI
jgi:hypothetical protein